MTSPTRSSEYDLFGPWIDVVEREHQIPRLYRTYGVDLGSAEIVLKVPRNIARRDANPQMDLYDHLLILNQDTLTVLSRHTGKAVAPALGFHVHEVPIADVVAVGTSVNLLDGELAIARRSGEVFRLNFNGSSHQRIDDLSNRLMMSVAAVHDSGEVARSGATQRLVSEFGSVDRPSIATEDLQADLGLVSAVIDAERLSPDLEVIEWAGRDKAQRLRSGPGSAIVSLVEGLWPTVRHGVIVGRTGVSLDFFTRRRSIARASHPEHSSSRLRIPLASLSAVTIAPHPRYAGCSIVQSGGGAGDGLSVVVPSTLAVLEALGTAK